MSVFKLICILFISSNLCWGQGLINEGYKNDLGILMKTLETSYPSLYRFKSKAEIDKLFEKCSRQISGDATERDFYKILKYFLSNIEDGHLSCSAPDSLENYFDEKEKHFPSRLYFTGNKAYIDCSVVNNLPPGTEIIKINGEKINTIRKTLFNYIVSDGEIETKKYWILNRNFWFYYSLVYEEQAQYEVTYRGTDGKHATLLLNGETLENIECKSFTETTEKPLLRLEYLNHHNALLTISTFSNDDLTMAGFDFVHFLTTAFNDIREKQIGSLIIDLRGNGGGRDVYGALLFSFLTDKTFYYYEKLETSTKVLDTADHPNLVLQKPQENHFSGNVYVLINGLSFSATSEFCTIVKDHNRAMFIGEETGGTYCGNTSGSFKEVILPFSKFTVSVPTTKYVMVTKNKKNQKRGILPDRIIMPEITDLLNERDVQLNLAVEIAEKEFNH